MTLDMPPTRVPSRSRRPLATPARPPMSTRFSSVTEPDRPDLPAMAQSSPSTQLWPMCTCASILQPRPRRVTSKRARSTVVLAPSSTSSPSSTMPTCGIFWCRPCPSWRKPKPSAPTTAPGLSSTRAPRMQWCATTALACSSQSAPSTASSPTKEPGQRRQRGPMTAPAPTKASGMIVASGAMRAPGSTTAPGCTPGTGCLGRGPRASARASSATEASATRTRLRASPAARSLASPTSRQPARLSLTRVSVSLRNTAARSSGPARSGGSRRARRRSAEPSTRPLTSAAISATVRLMCMRWLASTTSSPADGGEGRGARRRSPPRRTADPSRPSLEAPRQLEGERALLVLRLDVHEQGVVEREGHAAEGRNAQADAHAGRRAHVGGQLRELRVHGEVARVEEQHALEQRLLLVAERVVARDQRVERLDRDDPGQPAAGGVAQLVRSDALVVEAAQRERAAAAAHEVVLEEGQLVLAAGRGHVPQRGARMQHRLAAVGVLEERHEPLARGRLTQQVHVATHESAPRLEAYAAAEAGRGRHERVELLVVVAALERLRRGLALRRDDGPQVVRVVDVADVHLLVPHPEPDRALAREPVVQRDGPAERLLVVVGEQACAVV